VSLARSPRLTKLFVSPGNPGCAEVAQSVAIGVDDHEEVVRFCLLNKIDLVVVGPEGPLVAGIADALAAAGVLCFGPSKAAARLEGSKAFTKEFCDECKIPTAAYRRFRQIEPALAYVRAHGAPIVIKADGLASGKGVVVAASLEEATQAVVDCFDGRFGAAGSEIVAEEMLVGQEVSYFALSDGRRAIPFGVAQDHKRVGDGDTGPNTGGMGAYAPVPFVDDAMSARILAEIVEPAIRGMARRGTPFRGVLFAGLMIDRTGPKLIEFNVRFGDPEAQVLFERLQTDPLELFAACARGELGGLETRMSGDTAVGVVMATKGYPGQTQSGSKVLGLREVARLDSTRVLQGATVVRDGQICANGGRVLTIVGVGGDLKMARRRAYDAVRAIDWPEGYFRNDIGLRAAP